MIIALYSMGAGIFTVVALDAIRTEDDLAGKNIYALALAVSVWSLLWPIFAALIAHNTLEKRNG